MPNHRTKDDTRPFSLRFTREERAALERRAAGMSLAAYIRSRLFESKAAAPRQTRGKFPVKDQKALAKLLGMMGQSQLGANLKQLARDARMGTLPLNSETEHALTAACRAVLEMKALLMKALGIQER